MPHSLAYLPLLLAAAPVLGQDGRSRSDLAVAQLRVQQRIIVRIPRLPIGRQPLDAPPIRWEEKKGPKCLPVDGLQGASLAGRNAIDLIADGDDRFRAVLDDDCSPMDFYSGFYLKPTADGMVCAGRDSIRARSGGSCRIDTFRKLVARR
ncbi:hypothetical protein [Sphingomonas aracearum]|uniref:Uncharacterized protein n=1 Tax=Sphingomonas aracearum TaxID=2283317 RepID=A0A369W4B3_9SPHN|nr:hypothetical protein [Sphingomonas aracearum]RDE06901.1 hypothetical protein DVW87_04315 [Sphingomonas aracearum]